MRGWCEIIDRGRNPDRAMLIADIALATQGQRKQINKIIKQLSENA